MQNNKNPFDEIQKKTNVNQADLFNLANSVNQADLKDEKAVRQLIAQVAKLANRKVSKEKEDQLVKAIVNNNIPTDFSTLAKMFGQK